MDQNNDQMLSAKFLTVTYKIDHKLLMVLV